ncbi:MAG TPA: pyridoxamine 5'-phosphate oxidase [Natronosporangium sp.]|nr:pyridoxamine 5'-phosphate oxidase [Natronosporangium sp.]
MDELVPIGEAARRVGVATSALRYYEERGLVHPARWIGGRRWYGREELRRFAFIRMAQQLGFGLEAIGTVLNGTGRSWREAVDRQLRELDERITQAEQARHLLRHARTCPEERPWQTCRHVLAELDAWLAGGRGPGPRPRPAPVGRPWEPAPEDDPVTRFQRWREEVAAAGVRYPDAMVLATVDDGGVPDARTVLLAGVDQEGLRFFSDQRSVKAAQLAARPHAAVVFGWYVAGRQVRVVGAVSALPRAEAVTHFAGLGRDTQLVVHACHQSQVVSDHASLEAAYEQIRARWPAGEPVPAPEHWGGWLIRPHRWEFWRQRSDRLHDRIRYRRSDQGWIWERLAP